MNDLAQSSNDVTANDALALVVLMVTPMLRQRQTTDLMNQALKWDRTLYTLPRENILAIRLAQALLEIHRVLDNRLTSQYVSRLQSTQVRGPLGIHAHSSPNEWLLEDIHPFGNIDIPHLRLPPVFVYQRFSIF